MSLIIKKSNPLYGSVDISGSKNAALPIMAASLLSCEKVVLTGIPRLSDIVNMMQLISFIGSDCTFLNNCFSSSCKKIINCETPYNIAKKLRASILLMGPILARKGVARISLPGGCNIGSRPIDLHLKGMASLGAKVKTGHGFIEVKAKKLVGNKIYLDFPSVGATENIMMASALADGQTIIENSAVEPEIVDTASFINAMGGDIIGAGTDTIRINGVEKLHGVEYNIIPDRIEAGTFMAACAVTSGNIEIKNVVPEHLKPICAKLREMGVAINEHFDSIELSAPDRLKSTDIKTLPFPGFPTDMQAPFCSLLSVSDGTGIVIETVFENRFNHACELMRMGANIKTEGSLSVIEGVKSLCGAKVRATDLRSGAALSLAGLKADGTTIIEDCHHILRGYENFDLKLRKLGADAEFSSEF